MASTEAKRYIVYVDDNFHHMDKSERYKLGEYTTCKEAISACKLIVEEYMEKGYSDTVTYEELYKGYTTFGEDPFIQSDDENCKFSAWDYAKKRCKELTKKD